MFSRIFNYWSNRSTVSKVTALTSEKIALFINEPGHQQGATSSLQIKNIRDNSTTKVELKGSEPSAVMHINNQTLIETVSGDIHFLDEQNQQVAVNKKEENRGGYTLTGAFRFKPGSVFINKRVDLKLDVRLDFWEVMGTEFKKINSLSINDIPSLPASSLDDGVCFWINFQGGDFNMADLHLDLTTHVISKKHFVKFSAEEKVLEAHAGLQRYKSPYNQAIIVSPSSEPNMFELFHYSKTGKFVKKIQLPIDGTWEENSAQHYNRCYLVVCHGSKPGKRFFSVLDRSDKTFAWHHKVFSVTGPVKWVLCESTIVAVNANSYKIKTYDFLNTDDINKVLKSSGSPLKSFSPDLTAEIAKYACSVRARAETCSILFPKIKKLDIVQKKFRDKLAQLTYQIKLIVELTNTTPKILDSWLSNRDTSTFSSLTALKQEIISLDRTNKGLDIWQSFASLFFGYILWEYAHPLMCVYVCVVSSIIYNNPARHLDSTALNELMGILNETINAYNDFYATAFSKNFDMRVLDNWFEQFKDDLQEICRIPQRNPGKSTSLMSGY